MGRLSSRLRGGLPAAAALATFLAGCTAGNLFFDMEAAARMNQIGVAWYNSWGTQGTGVGQFESPAAITTDSAGNVYIADSSRVQCFNAEGTYLRSSGVLPGFDPRYMAVDGTNSRLYVTDRSNNSIRQFALGDLSLTTSWGSTGSGNGQFQFISGIALDASSNIYVVDGGNNRVQKFDPSRTFIGAWGSQGPGAGQFNFLANPAIARNPVTGYFAVADSGNTRLQYLDTAGVFMGPVPLAHPYSDLVGNVQGLVYPVALACDSGGSAYISCGDVIFKFTAEGTCLGFWRPEHGVEYLYMPVEGIALSPSGSMIYIVLQGQHQVQAFTISP